MLTLWNFLPDLALAGVCILGDRLLEEADVSRSPWMRAFVDSSTHGTVGLLSWMAVLGRECSRHAALQIFMCGVLASLVDCDHFLAARSLRLKDALSLASRPPFHNTSLLFIIFACLLYVQRHQQTVQSGLTSQIAWIFLVAWLSHHLRDAHRRGLWFWPLGSTPPLPRCVYIGSIMILPLVVRVMIYGFQTTQKDSDSSSRLTEVVFQKS